MTCAGSSRCSVQNVSTGNWLSVIFPECHLTPHVLLADVRKLTQILSSNFLLLMQVTNDAGVFFYSQSLKIPVFIAILQFYTSYYGIKDGIGMSLNRGFFLFFYFLLQLVSFLFRTWTMPKPNIS